MSKIGSIKVFGHFHEPGSAVDGSCRCIHVFISLFVPSTVDRIKCKNKAQDCRTLVFIDRE